MPEQSLLPAASSMLEKAIEKTAYFRDFHKIIYNAKYSKYTHKNLIDKLASDRSVHIPAFIADEQNKRNWLQLCQTWRQRSGTIETLKDITSNITSYSNIDVIPWYKYNGKPYTFTVKYYTDLKKSDESERIKILFNYIHKYKAARDSFKIQGYFPCETNIQIKTIEQAKTVLQTEAKLQVNNKIKLGGLRNTCINRNHQIKLCNFKSKTLENITHKHSLKIVTNKLTANNLNINNYVTKFEIKDNIELDGLQNTCILNEKQRIFCNLQTININNITKENSISFSCIKTAVNHLNTSNYLAKFQVVKNIILNKFSGTAIHINTENIYAKLQGCTHEAYNHHNTELKFNNTIISSSSNTESITKFNIVKQIDLVGFYNSATQLRITDLSCGLSIQNINHYHDAEINLIETPAHTYNIIKYNAKLEYNNAMRIFSEVNSTYNPQMVQQCNLIIPKKVVEK